MTATPIYLVSARHERFDSPTHAFTMKVPMVRVPLPKSGNPVIQTEYGVINPDDRRLKSVADLKDKICDAEGIAYPARVDLISPPRRTMRFGAMAVYIGYANGASEPYFYVLEAGLATGQPKELFVGKTMSGNILQKANYEPTPFARATHWYHGAFRMKQAQPDEPGTLTIEVKKTKQGPAHLRVDLRWARVTADAARADLQRHNPLGLILNAASRVEVIDDLREEDLDNLGIFEPFANLNGPNLKWEKFPTK